VQRVDLGAALALGLIAHASRARQHGAQDHLLEPPVAFDLTQAVTWRRPKCSLLGRLLLGQEMHRDRNAGTHSVATRMHKWSMLTEPFGPSTDERESQVMALTASYGARRPSSNDIASGASARHKGGALSEL
jgi:hypothetical protein